MAGQVQAQTIRTEDSQPTRRGSTERVLAEVQTQYDQKAWVAAAATLRQLDGQPLNAAEQAEHDRLEACIAFEQNPETALPLLLSYLKNYPDTPEKDHMTALLAGAYYANGNSTKVVNLINDIDRSQLSIAELQRLTLTYGLALINLGEIDEARLQLRTAMALSNAYYNDATFASAYLDYMEGHYDEARKGFNAVQNSSAFRDKAIFFSAECALENGDYTEAESMATVYLKETPTGEQATNMKRVLGEAYYGQKRYTDAALQLEEYLAEDDEPNREALFRLGMSHYNSGEYLRAPEVLHMVTDIDDATSQCANMYIGLSYLKTGDANRARMAFEQAAAMTGDDKLREQAMYNYIACLHETGYSAFGESVTVSERFLNEYPDSPYADKVNSYLAETYMNTKNYDAALASIEKINRPSNVILKAKQKLLYKSGIEAFTNQRFDEALTALTQSLGLSKYDAKTAADAFFWRGETFYRKGNFAKAKSDYQQYLSNATDRNNRLYLLALYGSAYCSFRQGNYDDASNRFDRFVETDNVATLTDASTVADAWDRIGDCYFQSRQYASAEKAYERAIDADPSSADYAVYQKAFSQGLTGRYEDKIGTLSYLAENFPNSDYADDALFEKGRSYIQIENRGKALNTFQELLQKYPESSYAPSAGNEIALLYYQGRNIEEAIKAYKNVILHYPGSEQANVAMRDLKSLYVEEDEVDSYVDFASQSKGMVTVDVAEHDSLTYAAAEQAYIRGEKQKACDAFNKYLQQFPQGAYALHAHYHLGCIYREANDYEEAQLHLQKVAAAKSSKYCEDATRLVADMAYNHRDFNLALSAYQDLKNATVRSDTRLYAQTCLVRCAYALADWDLIISEASTFVDDAKLAPETAIEVRYYRAKAYLAHKQTDAATTELKKLAKDTRSIYGAEAKYLLAQLYYDNHQLNKAEKEVLDYINVSTPHSYWLARSFILLSDVYISSDRKVEARQYLLSLKQNYQGNDDIAGMIEQRLARLQ